MKPFPAIALLCSLFFALSASAQTEPGLIIDTLNHILPGHVAGKVQFSLASGIATATNGIYIKYTDEKYSTIMTADSATVNQATGDVEADGHVRVESGDQIWLGEHIYYNFKTRQMRSEQFRTGKAPIFAGGVGLSGDASNHVYTAKGGFVTTDDLADPAYEVRASRIRMIPGKSIELWNAVVYVGNVPVFYFPYYKRNLGHHANNYTPTPGFTSRYGGYLLNTYRWYLGDTADGQIHVDYRAKRGVGVGPDVAARLGPWGDFNLRYYYTHDDRPNSSTNSFPQFGDIPKNRQFVNFDWQATPATNLNLKALVNYQSDPLMVHDFRPGDYSGNPQPNTFIEANKYWDNWSLDALTTPRVNSFFNQVERLPDVRLTGYQQQVLDSPVYYDSQSSVGWYRQFTTYTNGLYQDTNGFYTSSAMRADTYHQLTLPWTFFNWLKVTPRVGGRVTYYGSQYLTNGEPNGDLTREVFNTGVGASFKASQLWAGATNSFFQVNGLRHIIEPSINYVFVPDPSTPPAQLPRFDAEQPSLMLLPLTFTDYNSIDSIDSQNVIRLGLRNTLQTKRDGGLDNLLSSDLQIDCRLDPQSNQGTWNDLYSAVAFRPRSWLTAESQTRHDLNGGDLNMAFEQLTFAPNDRWSWGLGYWYLRGGQWGNSTWSGNNTLTSTVFVRMSDNWGARMTDNYNLVNDRLQEQFYTLYRDLRSWTAALTFRVTNNENDTRNYTVAIAFSLKASPSMHVGEDVVNRYRLVGE